MLRESLESINLLVFDYYISADNPSGEIYFVGHFLSTLFDDKWKVIEDDAPSTGE